MKLHVLHLMPYGQLPSGVSTGRRGSWVDLPRRFYDPVAGRLLYHDYLDQLVLAEQLGFDGVFVPEHHQAAHGTVPSPSLMAAILARETTSSALIVGNSIALYNPPTRVAEEMAMVDVLSGGRLVAAMDIGAAPDVCVAYGISPVSVLERFEEAHELIMRACREDEPFAFNGKYTKLRYVNVWPRPMQRPHPPVWITSGSSIHTRDVALRNDHVLGFIEPFGMQRAAGMIRDYWSRADDLGLDDNPYRLGCSQTVLVADSDSEAERLYGPHVDYFYNTLLRAFPPFANVAGFPSVASLRREAPTSPSYDVDLPASWAQLQDAGVVIAGSPATVRDRLREEVRRHNIGQLVVLLQVGSMPPPLVEHNMRLFANEVMPHLRGVFDGRRDKWAPTRGGGGA